MRSSRSVDKGSKRGLCLALIDQISLFQLVQAELLLNLYKKKREKEKGDDNDESCSG